MMTISKELESTIQLAFAEARRRRHEFVTLEHVLFALIRDASAAKILRAAGTDLVRLEQDIEAFFAETIEPLPEDVEREPQQTMAFWRCLQRAAMHVHSAGREDIDGGSLLVAFFREPDSHAVSLLLAQGVRRLDVLNYVAHGITKATSQARERARREIHDRPDGDGEGEGDEGDEGDESAAGDPKKDPLAAYTVNLVQRAADGKTDPLIGRAPELERTIQVLARRRKNNPILVGEAGVGKTAIVEGLALAIHERRVPKTLLDAVIYSLDMGALLAGTKFRGQFEERLKGVVNAVKAIPNAVLFIDEIHTIVGAGATSGGSMDASNLLKPALQAGELRCIGSTTFSEYKASIERDRALARRFQRIDVLEPTVEETRQILHGLKSAYEKHHDVTYTDESLEAAAGLAAKYINDRHLPDKAIDVIDEAGAADRLRPEALRRRTLGAKEIEDVVARMAKIPARSVSASDETALKDLAPSLMKVIYGQDKAIEALASAIKLSRSGLGPADKPIGSFLFSGPTGVGKTELAKQLAVVLGVEFLRFDMTEYMEKHTVSRLIGAPPGYVGFDQGGLLTDAVRKTPYAVVVLDEIEKAHPDVFNILLQVMDHATLTDNNGRKADFRHVVLIMTTNAGARELASRQLGFGTPGSKPSTAERSKGAIERTFNPEFRNRLDGWIAFDSLPPEVIRRVVDKLVAELAAQLVEKKVRLDLLPVARDWLAEHGFDDKFGARPMARLIAEEVKKPLAEQILFGALKAGGTATVDVSEGKIVLRYE
ncbi:MAG: ATP-dependent Clp protease ATP-binding subunit ClpA [Myxococcales bacterium]|nr:ATP-dependent Clp protease ATP-binding subunit ClpA [Myxococcales bacterium]